MHSIAPPDLIRDVYIALCRDNEESPSREGLDWMTRLFRASRGAALTLRSARIGPMAAVSLVKHLEATTVQAIDLYDNDIRNAGFLALLKFAERHQTFHGLNVGANGIGADGALALAEMIQGNTSLEAIELGVPSGYWFRPVGHGARGTRPGDSIRANYIDSNSSAKLAKALMYNSSLKYLGLGGNFIGVTQPLAMGSSESAYGAGRTVELDGPTSFGAMLSVNVGLVALDLSDNKLGNIGLTAIFRGLSRNSYVRRLNISRNHATFVAMPMLSCILASRNCVLEEIRLAHNTLGLDGAKSLAFGLAACHSLRVLDLEGCALSDEGVAIICGVLCSPLLRPGLRRDEDLSLFVTETMGARSPGDELQEERQRNERMHALFDQILESRGDGPNHLIVIRSSTGRIISQTVIPRDGVTERPSIIPDAARTLSGSASRPPDKRFNDDEDFQEVERTVLLTEPGISEGTEAGGDEEDNNDDDEDDFLVADVTTPHYESGTFSAIHSFNFAANGMGPIGIRCFCKLAASRMGLQHVSLSYNRLGNAGAMALASALLCDQLDMNEVVAYYQESERAKQAAQRPELRDPSRVNTELRVLDLETCHIGSDGFVALCFASLHLPNLTKINLCNNFIGYAGGDIGVSLLNENPTLLTVVMRGNQISHTAATRLSRTLARNRRRVALRIPSQLRREIAEHEAETKQLPILREELDFMTQTVQDAEAYQRTIENLHAEMVDNFARQKNALSAKVHQTHDATKGAAESAEGLRAKIPAVQAQITAQLENAERLLREEIATTATLDEQFQVASARLAETDQQCEEQRADADRRIAEVQARLSQVLEVNRRAEKLTEALRAGYDDIITRAAGSRHLNRTTGAMNPDIMAQVLDRLGAVASGKLTIPRPIGYDVGESLLTPPESPAPRKSTKGKKGKKGSKGKKSRPVSRSGTRAPMTAAPRKQ
ncbi:putative NOD3 protein [Giardia muris]|uniref:Putative NOD3 protein n=1 Tax=Giardia muris TaxID=5742 RepID=A0A4Z1T0V9_GIAMU|nr:putative NOD3 protein [Giardia muris]|eukprot:TNJ29338.1 putative NOD3 protein [Giardia muris]